MFTAVPLLAKDPNTGEARPWNPSPQQWIDGSVDNDLPMTRLAEMFNVNHFIVSQVNPHVIPFLAREDDGLIRHGELSEAHVEASPGWLHTISTFAKDEVMHRMQVMSELGILPNLMTKARSILSQRYSGDITIFPKVPLSQFPLVLRNPTPEFMLHAVLRGETATWPKLSRIQNHCAIELALDDAVQQLRARIAFSPSQIDLRLGSIVRPAARAGSESRQAKTANTGRKQLRFDDVPDKSLQGGASSIATATSSPSVKALAKYHEALSQTSANMHLARQQGPISSEEDASKPDEDTWDDSDHDGEHARFVIGGRHYIASSQPPTPWWSSARLNYFGSDTPALPSPVALHHSITMTPSISTQVADNREPTLESRQVELKSPGATATRPRRAHSGASLHSPDIDLSGTRGMVLRKKRSMSSFTQPPPH